MADIDQERAWAVRAQLGDEQAFASLVDAYKGPVYNLAYRMLGGAGAAEDATQETFLRAYKRIKTYDSSRKFSSWILSIASHHCIDRLRRKRGQELSMDEMEGARWIPDEKPRPEERTLLAEQRATVRELMTALPSQYRLVISLRYWHDMSYEEIAQVTESTQSAVKSRLHRARQMMAQLIAERDQAEKIGVQHNEPREAQNAVSHCF